MTWIEECRLDLEMDRASFARLISEESGHHVSETLIVILEEVPNAITHPNLADAIARVCGATREQRNQIVHKKWRNRRWILKVFDPRDRNGDRVVKLDREGNIVAIYSSCRKAAIYNAVTENYIRRRCESSLSQGSEKITDANGYSFRFADDRKDHDKGG